ncbi:hypothetical protein KCU71_g14025, partial [Aureobasidium melanogenum]
MGWIRNASPEVVDQSRYLMVISVCAVSVPLMTLIVILRGYHCLRINKNGRLSYYHLCLYTAFAVVYIVLAIVQTRLGLGLPLDLLPKANLELYTLLGYVENLAYILAKAAYNLALGFAALEYYHHLFTSRTVRSASKSPEPCFRQRASSWICFKASGNKPEAPASAGSRIR